VQVQDQPRHGSGRATVQATAAALAVLLVLTACAGEESPRPQSGAPPAEHGAGEPGQQPGAPTAPDTAAPAGPPSQAAQPPHPADAAATTDAASVEEAAAPAAAAWTAGRLAAEHPASGVATLRAVRSARHGGFDRIVLDFGEDGLPSWEIEYVDRPIRQCGSGNPVAIAGDGWLRIHMQPARAHTDAGEATIAERRRRPALDVLQELVITCDFEAHLEWVAGVASPNRFRAFELAAPARIVIDIMAGG
jgi:hypothetical protein